MVLEWVDKLFSGDMIEVGFYDESVYMVVNVYGEWCFVNYENVVVYLGIDNLFDCIYYECFSYGECDVVCGGVLVCDIDLFYVLGCIIMLGVKMDF